MGGLLMMGGWRSLVWRLSRGRIWVGTGGGGGMEPMWRICGGTGGGGVEGNAAVRGEVWVAQRSKCLELPAVLRLCQ